MVSEPGGVTQEGYARLPEDLLHDLLEGSQELIAEVERILGSNMDRKDELRQVAQDIGLIRHVQTAKPKTISGVDGGFAIERTASVDILLSVAVGVEGLSGDTTYWEGTQYEWWSRVAKHDLESERLCRGVMVAQELAILNAAPHDFRILDGSHLTPIIQLNSALTSRSEEIVVRAVREWERLNTGRALSCLSADDYVVAMPKYDASRAIADKLQKAVQYEIPGDDKFLLSLILEPGEYIDRQQVSASPWSQLHFTPHEKFKDLSDEFMNAIEPLRERQVSFTYFKPDPLSPAFRIEVKRLVSEETLQTLLNTIQLQMTGPFVREPYPQYLADVMAKSVGLGLSAMHSSVQLGLSRANRSDLAEVLMRAYRTEGV